MQVILFRHTISSLTNIQPMYSVGIVQMNFLKFFASRTRQRVTLYCNFSTGVKQNKTVRVVGYSEDYRSRLRAEVLLDDCTVCDELTLCKYTQLVTSLILPW